MSYNPWKYTEEQKQEAHKERTRREAAIWAKIVETIRAKGAVVETNSNGIIQSVNGNSFGHWGNRLEVKLETCFPDSPKKWSMGSAGRFSFGYNQPKFIEGKDGFRYDEIANTFIDIAKRDKERREESDRRALAGYSSQLLMKKLESVYPYQHDKIVRVEACQVTDRVKLHIQQTLTIDQAIGLLTILKNASAATKIGFQIVNPVTESVALKALEWSNPKETVLTPVD